jgi:hypothetical protein
MRQEVWYPLGGLLVLSAACFTLFVFSVHAKWDGWISWATGVVGSGLALGAGNYAARDTWLGDIAGWLVSLHAVVALALSLWFLWQGIKIVIGAIPDQWAGGVSMAAGLAVGAFFMPTIASEAMPSHGAVWVQTRAAVDGASGAVANLTGGWFW